jgi:hypothetical protein
MFSATIHPDISTRTYTVVASHGADCAPSEITFERYSDAAQHRDKVLRLNGKAQYNRAMARLESCHRDAQRRYNARLADLISSQIAAEEPAA